MILFKKNILLDLLGIMPGFSEHFIQFLFPLLTPRWWFHDFFPLILWQVLAKKTCKPSFRRKIRRPMKRRKRWKSGGAGWFEMVWGSSSTMSPWLCYNWMMICSQNDLRKAFAFGVFFVSGGILCLHVCENSAIFSFGSHKHVVSGVHLWLNRKV